MNKLLRPITPDEIASFKLNGVVILRGVLDIATVNGLRRCIDQAASTLHQSPQGYDFSSLARAIDTADDKALAAADGRQHDISGIVRHIRESGKPMLYDSAEDADHAGHFLVDTGVTTRVSGLRKFALSGAAPEIAAKLLGGSTVRFFGDQMFVKEPQTRERTAFHQDATYFEIEGDQCCVLWIPVDPATLETGTMMYVRGSHLDGTLYQPNVFVSQTTLPGAEGKVLPDIEGEPDKHDIVHFDVEPGDLVVHHFRTVHGAGGNLSRYQVRRALSIRYCGDDIIAKQRPWAPRQLHYTAPLNYGRSLDGPDFPVVWRRKEVIENVA